MPRNPAPAKQKKKPGPKPQYRRDPVVQQDSLPSDLVLREPPALEPGEQPPALPVRVIERRIEIVTVPIPLGEPPHRFDQIHIEGWLRRDDAHIFARLRQALRDQGARTGDGREVKTNPDILRWLMEQFASC